MRVNGIGVWVYGIGMRVYGIGMQARSQGFELGGSDFGHTPNHTQCHTPFNCIFLTFFRSQKN